MKALIATLIGMGLAWTGWDSSGLIDARAANSGDQDVVAIRSAVRCAPACAVKPSAESRRCVVSCRTAPAVTRGARSVSCASTPVVSVTGIGPGTMSCVATAGAAVLAGVSEDKEQKAWLGVQLSPLPEPLKAHLELDDAGVMLINVAEDSPAADAGLRQYDVLLEMDGEIIPASFEEFSAMMQDKSPEERVRLTIVRGAETRELDVVLGEWPGAAVSYVYVVEPENIVEQELRGLGQILSKGEDGSWVIQDLGEMDNLAPFLVTGVPGLKDLSRSFLRAEDESARKVTARRSSDEGSLEVTHDSAAGELKVTRTAEEGGFKSSQVRTYEDLEELEAEDPEAYELIKDSIPRGRAKVLQLRLDDARKMGEAQKEWALQLKRTLEENKDVWRGAHEDALKAYREAMKVYEGFGDEEDLDLHKQLVPFRAWPKWYGLEGPGSEIELCIEVDPDGLITVITRKGGTEVKRIYRDEEELEQKDPQMYERYLETTDSSVAD